MASRAEQNLKITQIVTLISTFFVMCILHLWFALPLLFAFATVMTLTTGRKKYCSDYCPLGAVQDYYPPKSDPSSSTPQFVYYLRWPVFLAFWGYLAYHIYTSFGNPGVLWQSVLLLMILSMFTAIFLQSTIRKRMWCSKVCPFGVVLDGAIKVHKTVKRK